jgi:hypothetical protein
MSKGWKAKYFKGFGSKKPTEPKHDSRNRLRSPMFEEEVHNNK